MIRINLMPFEERGQKARRPQAARKSGGAGGVLFPVAIIAAVMVLIVGMIVQQQAQLHMLTSEVARVERESQALAPQIAMVERLSASAPT
jgi:Tfp pilus assembly protein PilN